MKPIKIGWSEHIRNTVRAGIEEGNGRTLLKPFYEREQGALESSGERGSVHGGKEARRKAGE